MKENGMKNSSNQTEIRLKNETVKIDITKKWSQKKIVSDSILE